MPRHIILKLILAFVIIALASTNSYSYANDESDKDREVAVKLNELQVTFDQEPLLKDGRVHVPFRAIAEAMGVEVNWDEEKREVHAYDDEITILLGIGDTKASVNGKEVDLDTAPIIQGGRTLIPLRFFSEAFGCEVDWDQEEYLVSINTPPFELWVTGFYALGDRQTSSWTDLFTEDYPGRKPDRAKLVNELALGWYSIDEKGDLLTQSRTGWQRPDRWEDVLQAAEEYGLRQEMVVHVTDYVPEDEEDTEEPTAPPEDDEEIEDLKEEVEGIDGTITSLLSSQQAMEQGARQIAEEAASYYQGVNLNFEGLGLTQRGEELEKVQQDFTRFTQKVKEELKSEGNDLTLTLTLHAPNSYYRGYDYAALGEIADTIIIMAYDYTSSGPEPVSMVSEAVKIAVEDVSPENLLLGISMSSETHESVHAKLEIARRHGLKGISLWRLGLLGEENWKTFRKRIEPKQAP